MRAISFLKKKSFGDAVESGSKLRQANEPLSEVKTHVQGEEDESPKRSEGRASLERTSSVTFEEEDKCRSEVARVSQEAVGGEAKKVEQRVVPHFSISNEVSSFSELFFPSVTLDCPDPRHDVGYEFEPHIRGGCCGVTSQAKTPREAELKENSHD